MLVKRYRVGVRVNRVVDFLQNPVSIFIVDTDIVDYICIFNGLFTDFILTYPEIPLS